MAGKKQVKKVAAKKKAPAKKAPAKKASAKKAPAKKASAKKASARKVGQKKPARVPPQLAGSKPPRAKAKAGKSETKGGEVDTRTAAERLSKEWERSWARIVAKTWTDPDFKMKLLESPARMLAAEGLPMLHDVDIRIVAGEGRFTMEIPLPERPADLDGELIDDLLGDLLGDKFGPKKCVMSSCCC